MHSSNRGSDYLRKLEGRLAILQLLVDNNEIPARLHPETIDEIERTKRRLFNNYRWAGEYTKAMKIAPQIKRLRSSYSGIATYLSCLVRSCVRL